MQLSKLLVQRTFWDPEYNLPEPQVCPPSDESRPRTLLEARDQLEGSMLSSLHHGLASITRHTALGEAAETPSRSRDPSLSHPRGNVPHLQACVLGNAPHLQACVLPGSQPSLPKPQGAAANQKQGPDLPSTAENGTTDLAGSCWQPVTTRTGE